MGTADDGVVYAGSEGWRKVVSTADGMDNLRIFFGVGC